MTKETSSTPSLQSRLPHVGVTIFSQMSALAKQSGAVNLGQGFPDFDCDRKLIEQVSMAMAQSHNQYPPMSGVAELRQVIADKIAKLYGHQYSTEHEITVTAGGTQALFCAILCAVKPGDEVIVIEPVYDSYIPAITLAGGIVKPVSLQQVLDENGQISYQAPLQAIEKAITAKTQLLMINSPHNPTGSLWSQSDLLKLQEILQGSKILVCSDEVYEHMVYDGQRHESLSRYPGLAARSFVVSSFGKTLHVTGWKVGYVAAPAQLTAEFRKVHQFNVFTVNSPMQVGVAGYLRDEKTYLSLPDFYQKKRDYFRAGLANSGWKLLPCAGTYFQAVNYSGLKIPEAKLNELEFCQWLTTEIKVAAIPMSAFYTTEKNSGIIRFCFAKHESTLKLALESLARI